MLRDIPEDDVYLFRGNAYPYELLCYPLGKLAFLFDGAPLVHLDDNDRHG